MARWITFDAATAHALRQRAPLESVFEAPGRNALEYALSCSSNVVAALNVGFENHCALAVFRHAPAMKTFNPQEAVPPQSHAIRATGILGLADETVFEEDEEKPRRKNWLQRLWED